MAPEQLEGKDAMRARTSFATGAVNLRNGDGGKHFEGRATQV